MINIILQLIFIALLAYCYNWFLCKVSKEKITWKNFLMIYAAMLFGYFIIAQWLLKFIIE